ncbi:sperm flagellar 1 [Brachionus plicatilis]|uniref:Sperm flagellar 1 n=1 Tax=Brachionus plicatilis TaxID=10195 RepID=A0A3M7STM0_BRAPC|nr:sperm flagellar 1 [Brachionus plicatilis]
MSWEMELNDEVLEDLYEWIDQIPLSRQKKRIERDFSDGYCVGEIVKHFLPQFIELHNLTPAHNLQQKLANWGMLNHKVFSKFGLNVPVNITQNISNAKPGYIEVFLYNLRYKIDEKLNEIEIKQQHKAKNSPRQNASSLNKVKVPTQLRIEYEEKVQECLQQAEEIEVLNAKVRRLEHLLDLKETRISELTDKLEKYRPTGISADSSRLRNNNKNSLIVS